MKMAEPLGLPKGSVRSLLALGGLLGIGAITGFLLAHDASGDLTKIVIGADIAAFSNAMGYYFGVRPNDPSAPSS